MSRPGISDVPEPEAGQCSANAAVTVGGLRGVAFWYPSMGGYVGKAIALPDGGCVDVYVWHDGEFPFPGEQAWPDDRAHSPVRLHHCNPEDFIRLGTLLARLVEAEPES
jgi:hypothetical protein